MMFRPLKKKLGTHSSNSSTSYTTSNYQEGRRHMIAPNPTFKDMLERRFNRLPAIEAPGTWEGHLYYRSSYSSSSGYNVSSLRVWSSFDGRVEVNATVYVGYNIFGDIDERCAERVYNEAYDNVTSAIESVYNDFCASYDNYDKGCEIDVDVDFRYL